MEQGESKASAPHILMFPLPIQGPVNAMLKLAELFASSGLKVSFLNSEYNHNRLVRYANIYSRFEKYPGFEFRTIPDGLPEDHPRSGNRFMEMFEAMNLRTKPVLKEMLVEMISDLDCIIGDAFLGFVLDVANELGIPIINCPTTGSCYLWSNCFIPDLIEAGELPIKGNLDFISYLEFSTDFERAYYSLFAPELQIRTICSRIWKFCPLNFKSGQFAPEFGKLREQIVSTLGGRLSLTHYSWGKKTNKPF
ncbi:UDP-glucuronosyl/UDP-glucosyltransferase [Corchorus capsularis]|uniref:UDP-glucuronosyl/UDP-glucosyltransferase n=1 Tax=Corchorus capsularis TaxID=210143 RepID=A0A1R3HDP6_COCAP|nr:UDP-glucuronosyl/UDP-glucosyltransferase [Corchorus capsularis]